MRTRDLILGFAVNILGEYLNIMLKTSTNTHKYQTCIHAPIDPESLKYTIFTTYMSNYIGPGAAI